MKAVVWHGKRDVRVDTVPDPTHRGTDRRDRPDHVDRPVRLRPAPVRGAGPVHDGGRHPRPRADGHRRGGRRRGARTSASGDRVVVPFNISCGHCWMCEQRAAVAVRDDPGPRARQGRRPVRLHQALRPGARRAGRVPAGPAGPVRADQGARGAARRPLRLPLRRAADGVAGGAVRRTCPTAARSSVLGPRPDRRHGLPDRARTSARRR